MAVVYVARNLVNGKEYVGVTTLTLSERRSHHHSEAKYGSTAPFHKAIREYGINNFVFEVIEEVDDPEQYTQREIYWMQKRNTIKDGYNLHTERRNALSWALASERISAAHRNRQILKQTRVQEAYEQTVA